jgi:hypothetical protein
MAAIGWLIFSDERAISKFTVDVKINMKSRQFARYCRQTNKLAGMWNSSHKL